MDELKTYCDFVNNLKEGEHIYHKVYHDHHYGFMIDDDNELFGRLILEINQAGLSWTTILKKEDNFRRAYDNFNINKIANYSIVDIERLMQDAGIIRNKLKILATISNAQILIVLQKQFGSFKAWLEHYAPQSKQDWVKLFKKTFKFTGGEIVGEFLMSIGFLPGAHVEKCPIFRLTHSKAV